MNIFYSCNRNIEKKSSFLDDFDLFLVICGQKKISGGIENIKIWCAVIPSLVYLTKLLFYHEYFYSYIRSFEKKILQIADFAILGPNISAPRFFPDMQFVAVNSKYSLISHMFDLTIFNDREQTPTKVA